MKNIKVGIDFGTSQTKICSRVINKEIHYVFHEFSKNNKYILPTTIKLNEEGNCEFGIVNGNPVRFFKMKALFSENIDYKVKEQNQSANFDLESHPEISCILYICYCILDLKKSFDVVEINTSDKIIEPTESKGILNTLTRFFKGSPPPEESNSEKKSVLHSDKRNEFNFHFTIGIPTRYDWSREEHQRRSLQYEMLYLALELSNSYADLNLFLEDNIDNFRNKIKSIYISLLNEKQETLYNFYLNKNIYVVAETTAGIFVMQNQFERTLQALENNHQAQEKFQKSKLGNYITMDVGAGTTDVSFFKLAYSDNKVVLVYFASQAIDYASNFIIKNYLKLKEGNENISEDQVANFNFKYDINIWNTALGDARSYLFSIIKRELLPDLIIKFNNNFHKNWNYEYGVSRAKGCKVYGGGSKLNAFATGELILHSQGSRGYNPNTTTTTEIESLIVNEEYLENIELRNANEKLLTKIQKTEILLILHLLNTSLGLSLVDVINNPNRQQNNRNHSPLENLDTSVIDPDTNTPFLDGGMARFDIFNRDWI